MTLHEAILKADKLQHLVGSGQPKIEAVIPAPLDESKFNSFVNEVKFIQAGHTLNEGFYDVADLLNAKDFDVAILYTGAPADHNLRVSGDIIYDWHKE